MLMTDWLQLERRLIWVVALEAEQVYSWRRTETGPHCKNFRSASELVWWGEIVASLL